MPMICRFCGADNDSSNERCFSCDAPLPKRSDLSEKDYNSLKNYIGSVENMLAAAKVGNDSKIIIIFIVGLLVIVAGTYFAYVNSEHKVFVIILSVIVALASLLAWGGVVSHHEKEKISKKYHEKIKKEIEEYLRIMDFKSTDFKAVASETLPKKAFLFRFLDDF